MLDRGGFRLQTEGTSETRNSEPEAHSLGLARFAGVTWKNRIYEGMVRNRAATKAAMKSSPAGIHNSPRAWFICTPNGLVF